MCCQRFEGSVAQQCLDGLPVRRSLVHNESRCVKILWLIFERSKVIESCKLKLFRCEEASFEWDWSISLALQRTFFVILRIEGISNIVAYIVDPFAGLSLHGRQSNSHAIIHVTVRQ